MKPWTLLCLALLPVCVFGQTGSITGYCEKGSTSATVQGLNSTNKLQGMVPSCTVTVYLSGTQTLANPLYANAGGTPLTNPFQANSSGQWLFFVAIDKTYDVVMNGGTPPSSFASPVVLTGLVPYSVPITKTYVDCTKDQANGIFNVTCYGAVSGSPDVTPAFQNAINAAAVVGGIPFVPVGLWKLNGPINPACDGVVCFPGVSKNGPTTTIRLQGVTHQRQDQQFQTSPSTTTTSIITSTTTGDANAYIFGVTPSDGFGGLSNIDVYISDITFRTYPDPQIGCFDLYKAAGGAADHFHCGIGENYGPPLFHTEPTHHNTGVRLPATNNDTLSRATWGEIEGYWDGLNVSEHAYIEGVWVGFTKRCMVINQGFHPISGKIGCQEGGVPVTVLGQATADFFLALEIDPAQPCSAWCYSAVDVDDPSALLIGRIKFTKVQGNVGIVGYPLAYSGGNNNARLSIYNEVDDNASFHAWERSRLSIGVGSAPDINGLHVGSTIQYGDFDMVLGSDNGTNVGVIQGYSGGNQNIIGSTPIQIDLNPYGGKVYVGPGGISTSGPVYQGTTQFTVSGCTASAPLGSGTSGVFTIGATVCPVTVKMNGDTNPITAANGWSCQAHDQGHPTALIGGETSSTTTTATFTIPGTAGAGDVISFNCSPY